MAVHGVDAGDRAAGPTGAARAAAGEAAARDLRRDRMGAIAHALRDEPMSVRAVAKAAGMVKGAAIAKSSAYDALVDLEIAGRAVQTASGWKAGNQGVRVSESLKGREHSDTLFRGNGEPPTCDGCGSLLADVGGRWACMDRDCGEAGR